MSRPRWIEETFHQHWRVRLEVSRVLHEVKTRHQHVVVFTNETWKTVLMIDGVVQLTTSDEWIYHELMAHVPLLSIDAPKHVLVVGGGDGGVLREVLKHPTVEKATLCEIDRSVIDLSLKYFPEVAAGSFDDRRAEIVIADGVTYVADTKSRFDAIVVDSSEPIGPSAVLHTREFFAACKRALKAGGVLVTQNGLPFHRPDHLRHSAQIFYDLFKHPAVFLCSQPCYFGGPFSHYFASDRPKAWDVKAAELRARIRQREIATRYYNPDVHKAAFAVPGYVQEIIDQAKALPRSKAANVGKRAA